MWGFSFLLEIMHEFIISVLYIHGLSSEIEKISVCNCCLLFRKKYGILTDKPDCFTQKHLNK